MLSKFSILPYSSISVEMAGVGHESLNILNRFAHNLLSVLDPDSTVAEPHVSVFQLPTKAKLFAFSISTNKNRPRKA
jgi:hypothetical protein